MTARHPKRVFALPGMGADRRMYPSPWNTLADLRYIEWDAYSSVSSIPALAERIRNEWDIKPGDIVIGCSLGGMVACEISRKVPLAWTVLIGSAVSKSEINPLLRLLHPLARVTPFKAVQALARRLPYPALTMFASANPHFIRTMCSAVFAWDGLNRLESKLLRLHGQYDPIISRPSHADLVLGGRHLISMTHAAECVAFLKQRGL